MEPYDKIRDVVGPKGWFDKPEDLEPYITEHRDRWRGQAQLVVRPKTINQVSRIVKICGDYKIPITPQGGNTGLVGGGVPNNGIVLSLERLNQIRQIDAVNNTMTVDAGCILKSIQNAASQINRLFPLSLAAEGSCQIGGNLSTNAGGVQVLRYGNARDLVLGLEVVLPDGEIWNGLKQLRKDNTGYDLKHLFIGAEGTLGIITGAVLKLYPKPMTYDTAIIALSDAPSALTFLSRLTGAAGDALTAFEFMTRQAFSLAVETNDPFDAIHPAYVLIELSCFTADDKTRKTLEDVLEKALDEKIIRDAIIAESQTQSAALWHIRESIPSAQNKAGGSIKHDISVPLSKIPEFIDRASKIVLPEMPEIRIVAFGHMGDGNLHYNLSQPPQMDKQAFLDHWQYYNSLIHSLAVEMGGSFSAEHGIGQLKTDDLEKYKAGTQIDLMRKLKNSFDPNSIMNPGKVLKT